MNPVRNNAIHTHDLPDRVDSSGSRTHIELVVMRRVHIIRILKLVISTVVLAVLTSIAALWGIGREVWVASVLQNAPHSIFDLPRFYFESFMHTRFIVQVLSVLTLTSLLFLARETIRLLVTFASSFRA